MFRRSLIRLAFLLVALPSAAFAEVTVAFYSHDMGTTFPHAFFTMKGAVGPDAAPVDVNYGFTAVTVSPAVLMGPVRGKVETLSASYVKSSDRQFAVTVDDQTYGRLLAMVERWRAMPGKSYDLDTRNCIHFVAEALRIVGIDVVEQPKLMKKPRSFLEYIRDRNPRLGSGG